MKLKTRESLYRYAEHRLDPGAFLRACLANDLMAATKASDQENLEDLFDVAVCINYDMPEACHGSYKAVNDWLQPRVTGAFTSEQEKSLQRAADVAEHNDSPSPLPSPDFHPAAV